MQAQSEVAKKKKKKKKSKTEDNDSGVEVYFREEEEDEKGAEPKAAAVNQPSDGSPWVRLGKCFLQKWKMDPSVPLSAGGTQSSGSIQAAGGSGFLLGRRPQLPETGLGSAGRRLQ